MLKDFRILHRIFQTPFMLIQVNNEGKSKVSPKLRSQAQCPLSSVKILSNSFSPSIRKISFCFKNVVRNTYSHQFAQIFEKYVDNLFTIFWQEYCIRLFVWISSKLWVYSKNNIYDFFTCSQWRRNFSISALLQPWYDFDQGPSWTRLPKMWRNGLCCRTTAGKRNRK